MAWIPAGHPRAAEGFYPLRDFETEPYIDTYPGQETDNERAFRANGLAPKGRFLSVDIQATRAMVISMGEFAHQGSADNVTGGDPKMREFLSLENRVTDQMPPTFLWHCVGDESVPVENSLLLASAMQKAGVYYECHLFSGGAHGISMCNQEVETPNPQAAAWIPLCETWLNKQFEYIP